MEGRRDICKRRKGREEGREAKKRTQKGKSTLHPDQVPRPACRRPTEHTTCPLSPCNVRVLASTSTFSIS